MWRGFRRHAFEVRTLVTRLKPGNERSTFPSSSAPLSRNLRASEVRKDPVRPIMFLGFRLNGVSSSQCDFFCKFNFPGASSFHGNSGFSNIARRYATAAEALVSTEEELSDSEELQALVEEMSKRVEESSFKQEKKMFAGMSIGKYKLLKTRQIKMETEAWEEAAQEYKELLADMCEHKLAPNLPYVKSLFLGWFEPFHNAIVAEQDVCQGNSKLSHAPYFNGLPADMMAVITMHKLMSLLMTSSGGVEGVRVVQAAIQIGEAIEHEVSKLTIPSLKNENCFPLHREI